MASVNISFEVTKAYDTQEFREFIREVYNTEGVNLYLITTSTNTAYVNSVANNIGIDSTRVITCASSAAKLTAITNNDIDIHLEGVYEDVTYLNENLTSDTEVIHVHHELDGYTVKVEYSQLFSDALKALL